MISLQFYSNNFTLQFFVMRNDLNKPFSFMKFIPVCIQHKVYILGLTLFFAGLHSTILAQERYFTHYDEEGLKIKEAYFLENGLPHGTYEFFDESGELIQLGQLVQGKKEGKFVHFNPGSRDTLRLLHYHNNLREGDAFSWHISGELAQTAMYRNDQLIGDVTTYYAEGTVRNIIQFKNDLPNGSYKDFHLSGKLAESATYENGIHVGERLKFDPAGNLIQKSLYWKGVLEGIEFFYYPTGAISSQIAYSRGIKHGASVTYFEDGSVEKKGQYKKGKPEGKFVTYWEDGSIAEDALYKKGRPVGEIKTFHENGKLNKRIVHNTRGEPMLSEIFDNEGNLIQQSSFHERLLHVETKTYYLSGQLKENIPYKYGELDGLYTSLTEEGEIYVERVYQRGRIMREKIHKNFHSPSK